MAYLVLFTGKGGVGKSTISAASALHHAQQGLRTLLVSSDPAHSTDDTLGINVGCEPTLVQEGLPLWAKNLNAEALAADFFGKLEGFMEKSFGTLPGFDSSMLSDLSNFPGMDEAFAMEEIQRLCLSADYDVIVFDGAVAAIPDSIIEQLADGGRLVAIVIGEDGVGRAMLLTRHGEIISSRHIFEAGAQLLPGFEHKVSFNF
mgnify:CR=1 FL=1